MINCPSCDAINESHYKFCLGCGNELSSTKISEQVTDTSADTNLSELNENAASEPELPQRTMTDSQAPGLIPSVAPAAIMSVPDEASFDSVQMTGDPDATNIESIPSVMDHTFDAPQGLGDVDGGLKTEVAEVDFAPDLDGLNTVRLSEEIKAQAPVPKDNDDPLEEAPEKTQEVSPLSTFCPSCKTVIQDGFRFCGSCGAKIEETDLNTSKVFAELVFIHPSGEEGERLPLTSADVILGRSSRIGLLNSDPHLSPQHARFTMEDGVLNCEDLNSFNGIFTRLIGETELPHGGMFRIGQQLFEFERHAEREADYAPLPGNAVSFGSPCNAIWGRLSSVCGPQLYTDQWILKTPEVYLGREQGTLTFPDDVFISGTHCRLKHVDKGCTLEDLGSTNGTYVKRNGKFALQNQDFLLLGQQLFRVEY